MADAVVKFKVGDRVRRSDADDPRSIRAYRDMTGTVTGFDWTHVLVLWDIDKLTGFTTSSSHLPEDLKLSRCDDRRYWREFLYLARDMRKGDGRIPRDLLMALRSHARHLATGPHFVGED